MATMSVMPMMDGKSRPAAEVKGVRKGAVVAFGVFDPQRGTELLHVVCETEISDLGERDRLRGEEKQRLDRPLRQQQASREPRLGVDCTGPEPGFGVGAHRQLRA